jgi:hypothetical protein
LIYLTLDEDSFRASEGPSRANGWHKDDTSLQGRPLITILFSPSKPISTYLNPRPFQNENMGDSAQATADILKQVLEEYSARLRIAHNANILVSDANVANTLYEETKSIRNSYGPKIIIASRGENDPDVSGMEGVSVKPLESLEMDTYTHSVFGLSGEDPKTILKGLQWMIHALQPKGIAIVTSLKIEAGKAEGEGEYNVGLEEKMLYQSKGKIGKLTDVLEYAGFEKGRLEISKHIQPA